MYIFFYISYFVSICLYFWVTPYDVHWLLWVLCSEIGPCMLRGIYGMPGIKAGFVQDRLRASHMPCYTISPAPINVDFFWMLNHILKAKNSVLHVSIDFKKRISSMIHINLNNLSLGFCCLYFRERISETESIHNLLESLVLSSIFKNIFSIFLGLYIVWGP